MKSQDWAVAALHLLSFVFLMASFSIAYAKGPKNGPNSDVGTIHSIGAMNAVPNKVGNGGRGGGLGPQIIMAPVVPPAPAVTPGVRDLPGHGRGHGHGHEKSTKHADKDMEFNGSASPSAARRATNHRGGEAAAQVGSRQQEASAEATAANAKKITILPTCI